MYPYVKPRQYVGKLLVPIRRPLPGCKHNKENFVNIIIVHHSRAVQLILPLGDGFGSFWRVITIADCFWDAHLCSIAFLS
jgi:hypothetical protein